VTGGDVGTVTKELGQSAGQLATAAFVHGYAVAITASALALVLAAATAWRGLRRSPAAAAPALDEVSPAPS
jgi:hypothetical protein